VLPAEHLLGLGGFDLLRQVVERPAEVAGNVLAPLGPFKEDADVVAPLPERVAEIDVFRQPAAAPQRRLGVGLVAPEVRRGDLRFYEGELFRRAGLVKDSSADRRSA
jgi:hypothetical protein